MDNWLRLSNMVETETIIHRIAIPRHNNRDLHCEHTDDPLP